MKFVDEQIVESILTNLETGKWDVEEILAEFNQSQMPFLQFINSENFKFIIPIWNKKYIGKFHANR